MMLCQQYPVKSVCAPLELPRSSFYRQAMRASESDLRSALDKLAGRYPTYRYCRLTALLQRARWSIYEWLQRLMPNPGLQRTA